MNTTVSAPRTRRLASTLASIAVLVLVTVPLAATGLTEYATPSDALQPLTIGMMPAVDSIPLIVAEAEGYFADEGLDVTLELFRDQLLREAALQAGTIDATISDLVNAIRAWANGADYRVIVSTQGIFSIVTSAGSGIESVADWPAAPELVPTGNLEDSIVNYTAGRMLEAVGLDPDRMRIVPTTQIPVRLELVVAGELDAAVLPEPVTRMAVMSGATELVSTDVLDWTPGVLLATGTALGRKAAELDAMLRAYDRAVAAINANPDAFREIVVERAGFPPPTAQSMRIPTYRPAAPPTADQVSDVAAWMVELGLIASLPAHAEIVVFPPLAE